MSESTKSPFEILDVLDNDFADLLLPDAAEPEQLAGAVSGLVADVRGMPYEEGHYKLGRHRVAITNDSDDAGDFVLTVGDEGDIRIPLKSALPSDLRLGEHIYWTGHFQIDTIASREESLTFLYLANNLAADYGISLEHVDENRIWVAMPTDDPSNLLRFFDRLKTDFKTLFSTTPIGARIKKESLTWTGDNLEGLIPQNLEELDGIKLDSLVLGNRTVKALSVMQEGVLIGLRKPSYSGVNLAGIIEVPVITKLKEQLRSNGFKIVLVEGVAGSGKTTALMSAFSELQLCSEVLVVVGIGLETAYRYNPLEPVDDIVVGLFSHLDSLSSLAINDQSGIPGLTDLKRTLAKKITSIQSSEAYLYLKAFKERAKTRNFSLDNKKIAQSILGLAQAIGHAKGCRLAIVREDRDRYSPDSEDIMVLLENIGAATPDHFEQVCLVEATRPESGRSIGRHNTTETITVDPFILIENDAVIPKFNQLLKGFIDRAGLVHKLGLAADVQWQVSNNVNLDLARKIAKKAGFEVDEHATYKGSPLILSALIEELVRNKLLTITLGEDSRYSFSLDERKIDNLIFETKHEEIYKRQLRSLEAEMPKASQLIMLASAFKGLLTKEDLAKYANINPDLINPLIERNFILMRNGLAYGRPELDQAFTFDTEIIDRVIDDLADNNGTSKMALFMVATKFTLNVQQKQLALKALEEALECSNTEVADTALAVLPDNTESTTRQFYSFKLKVLQGETEGVYDDYKRLLASSLVAELKIELYVLYVTSKAFRACAREGKTDFEEYKKAVLGLAVQTADIVESFNFDTVTANQFDAFLRSFSGIHGACASAIELFGNFYQKNNLEQIVPTQHFPHLGIAPTDTTDQHSNNPLVQNLNIRLKYIALIKHFAQLITETQNGSRQLEKMMSSGMREVLFLMIMNFYQNLCYEYARFLSNSSKDVGNFGLQLLNHDSATEQTRRLVAEAVQIGKLIKERYNALQGVGIPRELIARADRYTAAGILRQSYDSTEVKKWTAILLEHCGKTPLDVANKLRSTIVGAFGARLEIDRKLYHSSNASLREFMWHHYAELVNVENPVNIFEKINKAEFLAKAAYFEKDVRKRKDLLTAARTLLTGIRNDEMEERFEEELRKIDRYIRLADTERRLLLNLYELVQAVMQNPETGRAE